MAYGPFRILELTDYTLTVDENGITNAVLIVRATSRKRFIIRSHRSRPSNISLEDKTILRETDLLKQTETTFSTNRGPYTETKWPILTHTTGKISSEGISDSKGTR